MAAEIELERQSQVGLSRCPDNGRAEPQKDDQLDKPHAHGGSGRTGRGLRLRLGVVSPRSREPESPQFPDDRKDDEDRQGAGEINAADGFAVAPRDRVERSAGVVNEDGKDEAGGNAEI